MLIQKEFDDFIEQYNADYYQLLARAVTNCYDRLLAAFVSLADLHDVIIEMHKNSGLEFRIVPYPLSFRANDELLRHLGFDSRQVESIKEFLDEVKETQGEEMDQYLASFRT